MVRAGALMRTAGEANGPSRLTFWRLCGGWCALALRTVCGTPPTTTTRSTPSNGLERPATKRASRGQPGYQPPGFTLAAAGAWGIGGPPGHRSDRVVLDSEHDGPIVLLRNDGKVLLLEKASDLRTMAPVWVNGTHALRDWRAGP